MRFADVSIPTGFTRVVGAVAIALIASATAVRPLRAQNNSTLTVSFGGFTTPTGADFAASEIRATVSYTIACGSNRARCVASMHGVSAAVTEPASTTALTNFQYSFDNGTTWTTLTTASVTITAASVAGTVSGSFLVRYQLGWQSGGNPYTPPGTYSFPVAFDLIQGQP